MPIIRSSRVLYKWLLSVVFGALVLSCRYGVELRVMCPVCGLLLIHRTRKAAIHTNVLLLKRPKITSKFLKERRKYTGI